LHLHFRLELWKERSSRKPESSQFYLNRILLTASTVCNSNLSVHIHYTAQCTILPNEYGVATSGSDGCNGGWPTDAYDYVKQATGIDTGASYPYTAVQGKCAFNKANSAGVVTSYAYAKMNNETDLEIAVRTQGPVS